VLRLGESRSRWDRLHAIDLGGDATTAVEVQGPTILTGLLKSSEAQDPTFLTGLFKSSFLGRLVLDLSDGDGLKSDLNKAFGVILRGEVNQLPATYVLSNFCDGGLNSFCVIRSSNFVYFETLRDGFSE